MSATGRISPSLAGRPREPTARQRLGTTTDEDLRPIARKSNGKEKSGAYLAALARNPKSPKCSPTGPVPVPMQRAVPPRPRVSPQLSPSILGSAERTTAMDEDEEFVLPPTATGSSPVPRTSSARAPGRRSSYMPVPDGPLPPSSSSTNSLLSEIPNIAADEEYGADERALNEFLRVHPMLSMEATNRKTLQLVGSMFEKASVQVADVPIIPFSYDASYLRPPNARIGERACACGDKCICLFMANLRHGQDTPLAFTGTEFLLPVEREKFLAGNGLPARRKKCLICTRYFQNLLYIQCRTDPNFKVSSAPLDMQVFGNVVGSPTANENDPPDLAELGRTMAELPMSASTVHARDGYRPEAMLFVDEQFATTSRASREGATATLMWKPTLRFCSSHYRYVMGEDGPHIVQVGIGADDPTGTGLGFSSFVQPSAGVVAPSAALGMSL